jgi:succinate-acetate transporter protein
VFSLLDFKGYSSSSIVAVSASYYFFGGIIMNLAAVAEFIFGNTYPVVLFVVYDCQWTNLGYTSDPAHQCSTAYDPEEISAK